MLPSLPEALAAISGERDRQLQHFEGLDTKAGVLLGFDGVLVALARNAAFVPRLVGVLLAAISAVRAMLTFRPRKFPTLDPQALRRYLDATYTAAERLR